MKPMIARCAAAACLGWTMLCPARGAVTSYPVGEPATNAPYRVTVEGQAIPLQLAGRIQGAYYARFHCDGLARAEVRVTDGRMSGSLRPDRFRQKVEPLPDGIRFVIAAPGPRVIRAARDGQPLPPLILLAEPVPPDTRPPAIGRQFRVRAGTGDRTRELQAILDDCAGTPGGGVVVFPAGIHRTGMLTVGGNTTVYLDAGATLLFIPEPALYPQLASGRQLLMLRGDNIALIGHGVIDGQGHVLRNEKNASAHLVNVVESRHVTIKDVLLRDSPAWTLHVLGCDDVLIERVRILDDWGVANTDGIDPDGSSNVRIRDYFGYCGDDAVVVKTTGRAGVTRPATDIEVRDSVVMTRKTALKLGTESLHDIRRATFQNIDVVDSSRGIGLWMRDGATFAQAAFRDIRMNLVEIAGEKMSGEPLRLTVERRKGLGRIEDILFEDIRCEAPYRSYLAGHPDSKPRGLTFRNCRFLVTPRQLKLDRQPLFQLTRLRDVMFTNCAVQWESKPPEAWTGLVADEAVENLSVDGLAEVR